MDLKYLGMGMIFSVSAGIGFSASYKVKKGLQQLQSLHHALELMRCEITCSLTPYAGVCGIVARTETGEIASVFSAMSNALSQGLNTYQAASAAVGQAKGLHVSPQIRLSLTDFLSAFGKYDLDGQIRQIESLQSQIAAEIADVNAQKTNRCRSYEILGICTGLALGILVL